MDAAGKSKWRTRATTVLVTLLLVTGVPLLVDHTSVQPGAALVKLGFGISPLVKTGADFAAVRSGSRQQVGDYATVLADRGFTVASLEYSLAPGHHYPAPVRQGTAALSYLAANAARFGGNPAALFVGGDSAGAQIASELAAVQTNPGLAARIGLAPGVPLRGVILFCGLYDMDTVGATDFPAVRTYLWSYTGRRDWTTYPRIDELSTTRQVTAAFPPVYLTVGDLDPFEPQARELESVLQGQGVEVTSRFWGTGAGLSHEYQFDLRTDAARTVLADTVAFLDGHA